MVMSALDYPAFLPWKSGSNDATLNPIQEHYPRSKEQLWDVITVQEIHDWQERSDEVRTVSEILKAKGNAIWSTSPQASVYEALNLMAEKNVGALVVLESQQLVGIFSERDYARKVVLKGKFADNTPVHEVMTEDVITINPSHNIEECMELMTEKRVRHLPVIDAGKLVGLISIGDVVKSIILDQKVTIDHLHDYISGKW